MNALEWFREAIEPCRQTERRLLTIIALGHVQNITNLTELARGCGLRESASRRFGTGTLRDALRPLQ